MKKGFPCPCCGFLTLSEGTNETFEICPVCNWEDDDAQFNNPDFKGGANEVSLNEAKKNYKRFGASSMKYLQAVRAPIPDEIPQTLYPKVINGQIVRSPHYPPTYSDL